MSSLFYSRQLLKRSLSELCHSIGFDRTSEVAMDILVEICERHFAQLLQEFNEEEVKEYFRLFASLFDQQQQRFQQTQLYLQQFPSALTSTSTTTTTKETFPHSYPMKKPNQIFLRIPNPHSEEIRQRDEDPSTEYLFSWLPLFPHRKHLFTLFSPPLTSPLFSL